VEVSSTLKTQAIERFGDPSDGRKVAVVTGAAGAIGAAIVRRLVQSRVAVVLVDLDGSAACKVASSCGADALVIEADLSRAEAPGEIMDLVGTLAGRLDYLVNNAGLNRPQSIFDLCVEDWDTVIAVNLRAPALLTQKAIPFWKAAGGGSVVTVGSRVWLSGSIPAYTASKAGVVGLTRSFAVELGQLNVRANVVAPSYIDTAFTRQDRGDDAISNMQKSALSITPLQRLGEAEDIANTVNFLISDEARFITGEVIHVCGGSQLASQSYSFTRKS
jgi:NAD(P)-dependent dehydrogenase (short-subunit alcohol dehydrogenase family)